jgi:hypothetical protein
MRSGNEANTAADRSIVAHNLRNCGQMVPPRHRRRKQTNLIILNKFSEFTFGVHVVMYNL